MKNYLKHTVWMSLLILFVLIALNYLPAISIAGHTLRKVDILADVRTIPVEEFKHPLAENRFTPEEIVVSDTISSDSIVESTDTLLVEQDSMEVVEPRHPARPNFTWVTTDNCADGITCIADYSDSTQRGMLPFYEAIDQLDNESLVRIAVFGDSFIEGDILTADLRSMLQREYGGCGVGFVPITSKTFGFRPTVTHAFDGWKSYSVTDTTGFKHSKQGVSGHYFIPEKRAFMELKGQKRYASLLDTCQVASLFYKKSSPLYLETRVNGGEVKDFTLEGAPELQSFVIDGSIGRIRWTTEADSTALFYGAAMDGYSGIILDNFSLRGSSGYSLQSIPSQNIKEFNALRPYDLIILQYGLNIVAPEVYDYTYYKIRMRKVINYLKSQFPQAGFLLLSVGDRDYRAEDGNYRTMPEIKYFLEMQREIAIENNIAFWNMFEAMGGEDSMYDLVHDDPSKANYDYTHINFRGGRFIARKLFDSILYGKKSFDKGEVYAD